MSNEHREELTRWAQSRTWNQIEVELHTSRPTIARWKRRFEKQGMAGLDPRHKGNEPRRATPLVQARVLRKTTLRPADGSTHWTCRKMAAALGLSKSTVQRIWQQARLKPHRLDRYMASNDPQFEEKAADIIGLYMKPPQHATVFCVDEKSAIQALDRLDPYYRCHRAVPNDTDSSTTDMERSRCMRPWR
jgi:Homeodomain-like domain